MALSRVLSSPFPLVPLLHTYHRLGLPPTLASYTLLFYPMVSRELSASQSHFSKQTRTWLTPTTFSTSPTPRPSLITTQHRHLRVLEPALFSRTWNPNPDIRVNKGLDLDKELLKVQDWPIWTGKQSTQIHTWKFDKTEMAIIEEGRMTILPTNGNTIEVESGDVVTFPQGSTCQAIITQKISKRYTEDPIEIANVQNAIAAKEQKSRKSLG